MHLAISCVFAFSLDVPPWAPWLFASLLSGTYLVCAALDGATKR